MGDDLVVSKSGSASRQIRLVENFVTHPNYDVETLDNDIAIIRVNTKMKLNMKCVDGQMFRVLCHCHSFRSTHRSKRRQVSVLYHDQKRHQKWVKNVKPSAGA